MAPAEAAPVRAEVESAAVVTAVEAAPVVPAAEVGAYARRRIEAIVEDALREAGVLGVIPTPLEAIRRPARVRALEPISALPARVQALEPISALPARVQALEPISALPAPPGRRLLGALWFERRVMYVDERQSPPRRRFTEAHELVHALCPWHEAVLRLDTADELFKPVLDAVEAEANAGAGMLIFQGSAFARRAAQGQCSIETAFALAHEHGASRHATLHHYVQTHPGRAAMLTVGRFPRRDGSLPVWRSVESPAFRRLHGRAAAHYPAGLRPGSALHGLAEASRTTGTGPRATVRLGERGRRFGAEAHYNRHAFLVLLS